MANFAGVLKELEQERDRLNQVIQVIGDFVGRIGSDIRAKPKRPKRLSGVYPNWGGTGAPTVRFSHSPGQRPGYSDAQTFQALNGRFKFCALRERNPSARIVGGWQHPDRPDRSFCGAAFLWPL